MGLSDNFAYRRRVFGYNEENIGMSVQPKQSFKSKQEIFLAAKSPLDENFPQCSYTSWTDKSQKRCAFEAMIALSPAGGREYCRMHAHCMKTGDHKKGFKILKQSWEILKTYKPETFIKLGGDLVVMPPINSRRMGYI